jgi:galactose mutarotase-like enzyme
MADDKVVSVPAAVAAVRWYELPALALEASAVRVVVIPELGGKIVSLLDKQSGREWLLPPQRAYAQGVARSAGFVEQDMSGWDEMFPTINAGAYPVEGEYFAAPLPDHGEVWSAAWALDADNTDAIALSVQGQALPYTLGRTVRVVGENTLRLEYEVVNTGAETLYALWAAHPQFVVDGATRIVLPRSVTQVVNVLPTDELPDDEQLYDWTETVTPAGEKLPLDRVRSDAVRKHRKFYLPPEQPVGWVGLQQAAGGAWLRLAWDVASVPYLGVWVDERSYNASLTVALEPSTGYYDSLTRAWQNGRVMELLPNVPYRWALEVSLGVGAFPEI